MYQVLFGIPGLDLPIYSYGLMMVVGFLVAIQLAGYLARRCGMDPDLFINAGLIALVAGIAGARLSHVIENFSVYTDPARGLWGNFMAAINIRSGGLTYYGGFLLAFPSLVLYAIWKKVSVRLGMDIVAPCIVIGLGFGRIGCFLNGCCEGARCDAPWTLSVQFPYASLPYDAEYAIGTVHPPAELLAEARGGSRRLITRDEIRTGQYVNADGLRVPIHPAAPALAAAERSARLLPAQLYSALTAFMIAAMALTFFTLPHIPGRGFALMLMLEGSTRYILELLRVEPPVFGNMSLSMIIGLGVAALGVILWITFGMLTREKVAAGFPVTPAAAT